MTVLSVVWTTNPVAISNDLSLDGLTSPCLHPAISVIEILLLPSNCKV
jgi:hypothetical protein